MDKVTLAAVALVAAVVLLGAVQVATGCAGMQVEANEPGAPANEPTCVDRVDAFPFVLLGFMALAGLGLALGRAALAWSGVVLAVAGCIITGLSWGGMLFYHSIAVLLGTTAWHLWSPRRRARLPAATVAAILSLPLGAFGAFALATGIPVLFDPCHEWDDADHSIHMSPDDPCRARSSSGMGRGEYLLHLASQQGLAIAAFVLAALGAWRTQASLLLAAGIAWVGVAIAWLFGFGLPFIPLAIAAAVACLVGARRLHGPPFPDAPSPP
ncbi:MAG TPA: hypothetical protein VJ874_01335 [Candidatus Thermoplasmatota archaeon]|nr:hypothetical protein [Candidatus Thermoplasmatota archaeon]